MAVEYVLAVSVFFQLAAAVIALRLIRITGRSAAWSFIAAALVLMAVRRFIPLYRLLAGDTHVLFDQLNEVAGLILSVFMAVGIWKIGPLFGERRKMEDALRKSEESIRQIIELLPIPICILDRTGVISCLNAEFAGRYGYVPEDVPTFAALAARAFPDPQYRQRSVAQWDGDVAAGNGTATPAREYLITCNDGSKRDVEIIMQPIGDLYVASFSDITERKRTEVELKRLTQRNEMILNSAGEGILGTDIDGNIVFINRAAMNMLGMTGPAPIGRNSHQIFHHTRQDGRPYPFEECPLHRSLAEGESFRGFDEAFWTSDGRNFPVEYINTPLVDHGAVVGAVVVFRDISERRAAEEALRRNEERLREAQRIAHVGSWELDIPTNLLVWSEEIYRIFEIDPKSFSASYEAFLGAIHPEDRAAVDDAYRCSLKNRTPYSIDHRLRFPDGRLKYVHEECETHYGADGTPVRSVGTVQDITARKVMEDEIRQLNAGLERRVNGRTNELRESQQALMNIVEDLNIRTEELRRANVKLQELDRLKSVFIASMSHELRTPLNSIIGFSSIMLDEWIGPLNGEQKDNLSIVLRSGRYLLSLINDVIDVSKIESGKIEVKYEDFDIYEVISESLELFRKDIQDKGLELRAELMHCMMHSDRRRLLQCVVNLLSNAIKFTERGIVSIAVRTTQKRGSADGPQQEMAGDPGACALDDNLIAICFEDTGIGIKEEDMSRLFGAFVRVHSPQLMSAKGTGLGLYLTKKIVTEMLKGEIATESEYCKGSRFTIRIPIKCERGEENEESAGNRRQ